MVIQVAQYAQLIQNGLNELSNLDFVIHSDLGDYVNPTQLANGELKDHINGILTVVTGDFTKVEYIENINSNYMLEFIVNQDQVDQVRIVLTQWAKAQIGNVLSIGDTNFLMTPTLPETGYAKNTKLNSSIPLRVGINIQSIANGLLSNMVQWSINGEEVKVENALFSSNRATSNDPHANKTYTVALNSYVTTSIALTIPYSFKPAISQIVQNILFDTKDEVFEIVRNDGQNTITANYILTNGSIAEESGKIVAVNCTFTRTK